MKRVSILSLIAAFVMTMFASFASAAAPDFQKLGFPNVVAEKEITPGQASSITYGSVKIDIPADAFTAPVKFQVIEGANADFQAKAPANETVLMNFAFKVTDKATNELVAKFNKPVMFFYTDAKINANSKYYDTTVDGQMVVNKVPAKIEGTTLSHPIAGAGVGWAVTSPAAAVKNATSPVTGIAAAPWMAGGFVMIIGAAAVWFVARRRTA